MAWLIAGGGGGAQHAAEVAELLGSTQVLVPADAGVVSALGCLASPETEAAERALDLPLDAANWPALLAEGQAIMKQAGNAAAVAWLLEAVYQGQSAALEIPFHPEDDTPDGLAQRFGKTHERVRGHAFQRGVRLLRLRGQWTTRPAVLTAVPAASGMPAGTAPWIGPQAIFTETTSLWVPSGWECRRNDDGSFLMRQTGAANQRAPLLKGAA